MELASHLTGRFIQFNILPFSFRELLQARGFSVDKSIVLKEQQGLILNYLNEYIDTGGYPEIIIKHADLKIYLTTLFESILFKDIVKRYNVRYPKKLYDLGLYLITNHSREFSYTRLKNTLDFRSVHTIENYSEYLKETFLFFTIDRYSTKIREQMKSPKKAYVYDTGIITAVKFKTSPDIGRLMENLAAIDLLRRGKECYYFRSPDGKEVDFAVKEGLTISQLIQVCYDLEDYKTLKRENSSLLKASDETGCKEMLVLTWDLEKEDKMEGEKISYLPLWKWLL